MAFIYSCNVYKRGLIPLWRIQIVACTRKWLLFFKEVHTCKASNFVLLHSHFGFISEVRVTCKLSPEFFSYEVWISLFLFGSYFLWTFAVTLWLTLILLWRFITVAVIVNIHICITISSITNIWNVSAVPELLFIWCQRKKLCYASRTAYQNSMNSSMLHSVCV